MNSGARASHIAHTSAAFSTRVYIGGFSTTAGQRAKGTQHTRPDELSLIHVPRGSSSSPQHGRTLSRFTVLEFCRRRASERTTRHTQSPLVTAHVLIHIIYYIYRIWEMRKRATRIRVHQWFCPTERNNRANMRCACVTVVFPIYIVPQCLYIFK